MTAYDFGIFMEKIRRGLSRAEASDLLGDAQNTLIDEQLRVAEQAVTERVG